jgi:hypothetical protein
LRGNRCGKQERVINSGGVVAGSEETLARSTARESAAEGVDVLETKAAGEVHVRSARNANDSEHERAEEPVEGSIAEASLGELTGFGRG